MSFALLVVSLSLSWLIVPLLALAAAAGFVALFSPRRFSVLAARGGRWVDTNRFVQMFDKPINVDRFVIRYSRVFGAVVILAVLVLAYVFVTHF